MVLSKESGVVCCFCEKHPAAPHRGSLCFPERAWCKQCLRNRAGHLKGIKCGERRRQPLAESSMTCSCLGTELWDTTAGCKCPWGCRSRQGPEAAGRGRPHCCWDGETQAQSRNLGESADIRAEEQTLTGMIPITAIIGAQNRERERMCQSPELELLLPGCAALTRAWVMGATRLCGPKSSFSCQRKVSSASPF